MNDLSNLLAKVLPAAVIASLIGIFYLLDVFSVRPGWDNAPPKRAAVATPAASPNGKTLPAPATRRDSAVPAPTNEAVNAEAPADVSTGNPQPGEAKLDAAAPPGSPQPMAPRYVPPGANNGQPLATDMNNGQGQAQLPNHEISAEDAARIEAEAQQQINETEAAAAAEGQLEQQQPEKE
jgi:hypothetical protein